MLEAPGILQNPVPVRALVDPQASDEMTLRNLLSTAKQVDHADFLARVDTLGVLGQTVMISNYSRFHNVTTYLRRYTRRRIGLALGVPTMVHLFTEKYWTPPFRSRNGHH